jgi:cellulose synthase (UDP-forming)
MTVKRVRHARLQMRLLARKRAFLPLVRLVRSAAGWAGAIPALAQNLILILGAAVAYFAVTTPLSNQGQLAFALISLGGALIIRPLPGRLITQILIVISIIASSRYLYWRATETLQLSDRTDLFFGTGLFLAEMYAWIVLLLGFFQTAWPLERKPIPMPEDRSLWPTIDVFIPTYNEPLKVVKPTVLAALAIDWPADKINIYILDDGRREEFAEFAKSVGVQHMTRPDNAHAKAGNINHALKQTSGEYVAIFDCDHIPTRTFLQIAMGWFLRDPKLSMLQTPHHFFSPDPFEKNLETFKKVPNEGELFYGLVQDGNDLWNATFFCGSCAVIKRAPLMEVGGVAVETVTEDAHTSLKMHRRGYTTAYLAIPQAAGFATESLSGHVGQRIRWARGMAQIFRIDNPLLGPGLKIPQRLCYLNAMLHFFYGLPRIVFLTAPLAYFFFNAHVIQASAITIALYALPHLIHANLNNSRIQGEFRHSFWAEVYESVLAWYIMRPTLMAIINPKLGKFNVTAKGGLNQHEYFDWNISKPYIVLLVLNTIGLLIGFYRLFFIDTGEADTIILNIIWTVYNVIMLGASVAVANEARQVRVSHRVQMKLQTTLRLPNGRSVRGETTDYSEGGVGILLPTDIPAVTGEKVRITLYRGNIEHSFPATVTAQFGRRLGLQFEELNLQQSIDFVQCTFARADSWIVWTDKRKNDRPLQGLGEILTLGIRGIFKLGKNTADAAGRAVASHIHLSDQFQNPVAKSKFKSLLKRGRQNRAPSA